MAFTRAIRELYLTLEWQTDIRRYEPIQGPTSSQGLYHHKKFLFPPHGERQGEGGDFKVKPWFFKYSIQPIYDRCSTAQGTK